MNPGLQAILAGLFLLVPAVHAAQTDVDVFIGTGGDGHTFPGVSAPFGMVQLSPDTRYPHFKKAYRWAAGYHYDDRSIQGFSHTHFSGTGHSDLGDVLLMPFSGPVQWEPGEPEQPETGYRSAFTHTQESAQPGDYRVRLLDHQIDVELTAGLRSGWHRYRFPEHAEQRVMLDLRSSIYDYEGKVLWSSLRQRDAHTLTGSRATRGWAPNRSLFFAIRFSAPITGKQFENRETQIEYRGFKAPGTSNADRQAIQGRALVAALDFGKASQSPLLVKVAISAVSEANALANLDSDRADFDFDAQRQTAITAWQTQLSVIDVDADARTRKIFATALYHSLLAPSLFMDSNGEYRGPDNAVHRAEGFQFHSTFSLWDTYRALHPLLTLIQPIARNNDFAQSLIASAEHSPYGILPIWQFHGQETWCMIGYHAVPVLADFWMKGIRGFDGRKALDAMVRSADEDSYGGLKWYKQQGYVPIDKEVEGASKTLEYAFDDWTISRMAESLGDQATATRFAARAQNYRNVFDIKTGFVRAKKSDGVFREPFDPTQAGYGSDYTEGSAWQYSWYVPHDTAGLIALLGGDRKFVEKLDALFDAKTDAETYKHVEDISGLIGHYAHGNEPSHHVAYLYNHAGAPWKTQARLTQIMASQYKDTPDGLAGNDDVGQMSAWYLFTALGFYPVAPASNEYVIGRPFVKRAKLTLPGGKTFTVTAENLSDKNTFVAQVSLNGKPLQRSVITHAQIMAGGELRFRMQATPDKTWGKAVQDRPRSQSRGL